MGLLDEARKKKHAKAAPSANGKPVASETDGLPLTDVGNAKRLIERHGENLRHCHAWGKWLVWDGKHWAVDDAGQIKAMMKETVLSLFAWARQKIKELEHLQEQGNEKAAELALAIKAVLSWALKSQSAPRINAAIDLARSEAGIPIQADQLDRDPWALNVSNGTIDLRTGKLKEHDRKDHLTKLAPVMFDPAAKCSIFLTFLSEVMGQSDDLVEFLKRYVGYCLTGVTTEHILAILWGIGANGKTTLINAVLGMMGDDYGMMGVSDMLLVKRDGHPTERADLFGKRLVVCAETDSGRRLAESLVKALTGGDRIRARRMREDFWEFEATHKVSLVSNHRPEVKGTDHGMWRRLRLVPFTVTIPDDKQDKDLPAKLKAETAGILAWAVQGCLDWQQDGLRAPAEVMTATKEYREQQDVLGNFLEECCRTGSEDYTMKASELYAGYRFWAEQNGEPAKSQQAFGEALTERGFERKTNNGVWYKRVTLSQEFQEKMKPRRATEPSYG